MAYLDIRRRDVAHHVGMVIYHSNGRDSFAVHELQRFAKLLVTTESLSVNFSDTKQVKQEHSLDGDHLARPDAQITQVLRVQLIDDGKATTILP
jgi:hypothetical protein